MMTTTVTNLPPVKRRYRWRWLAAMVLLVVVLVSARLTLIEGLWTPIRIVGPSMAPTLQGEHGMISCSYCQAWFTFDTQYRPPPSILRCPHCEHVQDSETQVQTVAGDRVYIDGWPLIFGSVHRLDVVAFDTDDGAQLAVKRVIGLPGEQVAIRGGEVYLNDRLWQKTLPEHRQLSTLVMTRDAQSVSSTDGQDTIAWQTCVPTVTDIDHYNPAVNRPTFDVSDVRVVADVWAAEGATFACRLHDGWQSWRIELDGPTGAVKLYQGDQEVATGQVSPTAGTGYSWEAAVVDRQVFVRVNDEVIVQYGFAASQGPPSFKSPRVAFGAQGGKVRLTEISVYRDIHWLDPVGLSGRWESNRPLAAGEYFVLGDNVSVSTDSRHFGAVKREQLRGLVRRWPLNDR